MVGTHSLVTYWFATSDWFTFREFELRGLRVKAPLRYRGENHTENVTRSCLRKARARHTWNNDR